MRLDKYLKVSRIIKRRTVAKEACDGGRVSINGTDVREVVRKESAAEMYRVLEEDEETLRQRQ